MKIFISSTTRDLEVYRGVVEDQIARSRESTTRMEFWGTFSDTPETVCERKIVECDTLIGIYAFRYGHCIPGQDVSITEQEYETATREGKRCLCYFAHPSLEPVLAPRPPEPPWKKDRLERFKSRVGKHRVYSQFQGPENLARLIANDLAAIAQGRSLGYNRADVRRRFLKWEGKTRRRMARRELERRSPWVASPIEELWRHFINMPGWHEVMRNDVTKICELVDTYELAELSDFAHRLAEIDCSGNYDDVLDELAELDLSSAKRSAITVATQESTDRSDAAQEVARAIERLDNKLESSASRRIFPVIASPGAGKTHFIASLLSLV